MANSTRSLVLSVVLGLTGIGSLSAQTSPAAPVITEPASGIVNPADVHMNAEFFDADGDGLLCTDWEIWRVTPTERVWESPCATGPTAVHAHLADGSFIGSHAGRTELLYETDYEIRVRMRDDSGDPASEWSPTSTLAITTAPPYATFPLEVGDVVTMPAPTWTDPFGAAVVLPTSATPPSLRLEQASGDLLLEIRSLDGITPDLLNPAPVSDHAAARIVISPGDLGSRVVLPETDLYFVDGDGDDHTIYLPSVSVAPGQVAVFWVTENGATYVADPMELVPDFEDLARGIPVPWICNQPGYRVEQVASGFRLPVNIAFVPNPGPDGDDPYYYVTELYGTIKVVTRNGTVSNYATGLLGYTPSGAFPGSGEQGLTGIVVDGATGDVYATMLYDGGPANYPRVVRFTSSDGGLTASSQATILDMVGESQGQSHQISTITIGPDDKLYVHNGDGFATATAASLGSYRGKILRLEKNGAAPTDNPYYDASDGIDSEDYVYAYGVRNPFGGDWRDSDGFLYCVENGPSVDRFSRIVEGQDYLWDGSDFSMTNYAIYNWNPATGPVNLAFIQPGVFAGSEFPTEKYDHAFVSESGATWGTGQQPRGKRIREFVLDGVGNLLEGPTPFVEYVGTGKATVAGLAAGPDGLYFTDLYKDLDYSGPTDLGARILRVRYVGAADFTADITEGLAPLSVQFQDTSSVLAPTGWEWDFGDGGSSLEQNPSHTYTADGLYDVRLAISGPDGVQITQKSAYIRVGEFSNVAFLAGVIPPGTADAAAITRLLGLGYDVTAYSGNPSQRPSAAQLAADFDLVVVSSTVLSSDVGGQFRDQPVPVLTWEQALLRPDRMPLADSGNVILGATQVDILDTGHAITAGLTPGPFTVYASGDVMSLGIEPFASGAEVLAIQPGTAAGALIVADTGATLLDGGPAAERRAFFFLENDSFPALSAGGLELFDRTVAWLLGTVEASFARGDCNGDGVTDIADPVNLLGYLFLSGSVSCSDACDCNDDGGLDISDAIAALGALFSGTGPLPAPTSCGVDPTADALGCGVPTCP